ncbi:saccharopine dehydrogenase C-terminal domain-containing protein [Niabella hibiscisoli]|uniref:saccharopine dehydrogenase C-terminal domain-containing protein n=1 Tax=Niabella hibiscisoli TaxID=1825928 RepID=UPI001F0D099D|nr:saccharopine dehydrogenase C-terminal domain-containing protein [Niabella hibiscisoli]MCH5719991.1 saccharopine dehydrogenase NADP-binding domain-containing protein [Niabella hibiscisoli]
MTKETKQILLFGAGKSATVLINYLLEQSEIYNWKLVVVDADLSLALSKIKGHVNGSAMSFNINDATGREKVIGQSDIVISMLPPALHYIVAQDCVAHSKNLLTASYLDEAMRKLENEINRKGLFFLCEMGLDPGIDHMSAMQLIHSIKNEGGAIKSFISHCGGLIAPESDNNPWHYKITWNPANIVNAGKTGAVYKLSGQVIEKSYRDIFKDNPTVEIAPLGAYAYYPNRDSLSYAALYGLESAHTFMRTTLRHPDFCKGWQHIIDAGLTDAAPFKEKEHYNSIKDWVNQSIQQHSSSTTLDGYIDATVAEADRELVRKQLIYLGLAGDDTIPEQAAASADILRHLLETRLKIEQDDKDMIIMLHEIEYEKTISYIQQKVV